MSIQAILLFTIAAVNSLLSAFVLLSKRSLVNLVYAVFVLFASMWAAGLGFFIILDSLSAALLVANFYYVAAAGIPAFFVYFSWVFLNEKKKRSKMLCFLFILPLLLIILAMIIDKHFIISSVFLQSWGKDVVLNRLNYLIYGLYFVIFVAIAYGKLFKTLTSTTDLVEKKQLLFIIWGTMFGFVFGMVFDLFLPFLGNYKYIYLGPVFSLSMVASIAYSISRYHLFDTKVIAAQVSTFILWIFLFIRSVLSDTLQDQILNFGLLIVTIIVGLFLMRSVLKEVSQREQLETLSSQLAGANEQLKALDQARADFITLTSHQLRTPPATLKWYLSAIRQGDYGRMDEGVREMIVKAEITNNSLISLIEDLLNASRIERGKLEFMFEKADIVELARFTVEQLLPQARFKQLDLVFTPPKKPVPEVLADREKIRQVINNFIDNAIKYTQKGSIEVKVETDEKEVLVKVIDTGKGVEGGVAPKLFAKYSRGKDAAIHSTGIGLGLFVAKIVIENHKGRIGVESAGSGKGSEFYFALPIVNDLPHTKVMDLVEDQKLDNVSEAKEKMEKQS